jgi:Tol biopolymer transport system component
LGKVQRAHVNIELAWSPDSKRIALNYGPKTYGEVIRVISIKDGNIEDIETGLVDINSYHLDWSPDGDRFVFAGYQGDSPEFWLMENFMPETEAKK